MWSFGYEIDGQAKGTERYEFGEASKWIGIHGKENSNGILALGIITMDPTCTPIDGELQIAEKEVIDWPQASEQDLIDDEAQEEASEENTQPDDS